jgi:hypothetical protein
MANDAFVQQTSEETGAYRQTTSNFYERVLLYYKKNPDKCLS